MLPGQESGVDAILHRSDFMFGLTASLQKGSELPTCQALVNRFQVEGFQTQLEPVLVRWEDKHDAIKAFSIHLAKRQARVLHQIHHQIV